MKREDRLHAALAEIAETADHVNHGYLICGKCQAVKALERDEKTRRKPKEEA